MDCEDAAIRVFGPWPDVCDVLEHAGAVTIVDGSESLRRFSMSSGATGFAVDDRDSGTVLIAVADFTDGGAAAELYATLSGLLGFEIHLLLTCEPPLVLARRPARTVVPLALARMRRPSRSAPEAGAVASA